MTDINVDEQINAVKRTITRLADSNEDKRIDHWITQLERLVVIKLAHSTFARTRAAANPTDGG